MSQGPDLTDAVLFIYLFILLAAVADQRLKACNTPPHWNIPPFVHMFKCFPSRSMLRVTVLSYAVPLLCEIAAFSFTAATRLVNPVRSCPPPRMSSCLEDRR